MSEPTNGFQWTSRASFVIAAAGATLSLNDFLTFPALAGQNGGGAFLAFYILFLFLLGLPLMMGELMLGRISRLDPMSCFETLAQKHKGSVYWKLIGFLSIIAALLIVATLSVLAGWSLSYFFKSMLGIYNHITAENAAKAFDTFILDGERMSLWHTLFVILLLFFVCQPIKIGIERLLKTLVPLMVALLFISVCFAIYSSSFEQSVRYLLYIDISAIDADTPLLALQRAFYTLTLGAGVMMAFGRYLPSNIAIGYSASLIIAVDLLFTLFVGLAVNALMFSSGVVSGIDNQFAFRVLPAVFSAFDLGQVFGSIFFLLLVIAALTTAIALLESPVGYLQRQFNYSRLKSTLILGVIIWLLGVGTVLSYSVWQDQGFTLALFFDDGAVRLVNNAGFHDVLMFLSSHLMQPLVALFLCIFVAWVIPRTVSFKELASSRRYMFETWNYLIRYITPALLLIVLCTSAGIF